MNPCLEESVLWRVIFWLWTNLKTLWRGSALGGWLHRRRLDLLRWGASSRTVDLVTREGSFTRGWEGSWLSKIVDWVVNLPVALAKAIYRPARGIWEGSLVYRGAAALGRGAWWLLGLFALVMLVAPHSKWDNLYAFVIAAGILGLFVLSCSNRERRLDVKGMGPWFALYLGCITLGFVTSMSPALSLRFFLFHLTCFFITLVTVSAIDRYEQLSALLTLAAVGLALAALYGCYQGYVGVEVVASQQDLTLNAGMPGRVYSFFDNPNNFAEVLVMLTPLVAALTLNAKDWRGRVLGVAAVCLALAAIGMTYGRACWLGLVLAAVVFVGLLNWRLLPVLALLGLCALPFLPQTIWNRILTIGNLQDSSARYRIAIYEDAGRLLGDYGITGVGLGSDVMQKVFTHYPTLYDGNYPIHTHNNYLQMWGEVGIFGLLAYLGLMFGQLKAGCRAYRQADRRLRRILAGALGGFVGILAVGLVEYTWFYPRNMFLFWFLFATIAVCVKLAGQGGPKAQRTL